MTHGLAVKVSRDPPSRGASKCPEPLEPIWHLTAKAFGTKCALVPVMNAEPKLTDEMPTTSQVAALRKLLDSFPTTTTLLRALAEVTRDHHEDIDGAQLIEDFADTYAGHEEASL